MSRTDHVEDALRRLDAADRPADPHGARPSAVLERILATGTSPAPPGRSRPARTGRQDRTARRRPTGRTAVLAAAVLAAATAGVVALPPLSGGDEAFASWTPDPAAVAPTRRQEAAADCRDAQGAHDDAGRLAAAEVVVAERRGVWTTVLLAGPQGFTAMCIVDESRPSSSRGMVGHVGVAPGWTPPGPRDLTATALGHGVVDSGSLSLAAGSAGSDVSRVVYRSPAHGEVVASVSRGHFALWLPGAELEAASRDGVVLEVTYRDGSTGSATLTL